MDRRRSSLAYRAGPAQDVLWVRLAADAIAVLMCFLVLGRIVGWVVLWLRAFSVAKWG